MSIEDSTNAYSPTEPALQYPGQWVPTPTSPEGKADRISDERWEDFVNRPDEPTLVQRLGSVVRNMFTR